MAGIGAGHRGGGDAWQAKGANERSFAVGAAEPSDRQEMPQRET